MTGLLLLALLQAGAPRVGDTVWVERDVAAPAGSVLRPLPVEPDDEVLLLGPPQVEARPGGWRLRYPLAIWRAGTRRITVPGPLVIRPDGTTDTLSPQVEVVTIASVLPPGRRDTLAPRPAAGVVATGSRTPQPVLVLLVLAGILLAPLHWWWRRTGPRPVRPVAPATPPVLPSREMLASWGRAGEWRAAADGWIAWLEMSVPTPDRDRVLLALRRARFEPGDVGTLADLCQEAASL